MDEATKKLLSETYQLAKTNNALLRKIDRRQRLGFYWKVFIGIIAIASALGIYYYVQPYFDQALSFYNKVEKNVVQIETFPDQIIDFLKKQ